MTEPALDILVQSILDQEVTDDQWEQFQARCARDPRQLEQFARQVFLHAQLREVFVGRAGALALQEESVPPRAAAQESEPGRLVRLPGMLTTQAPLSLLIAFFVTGALLLLLSLLKVGQIERRRPQHTAEPDVARIVETADAVWAGDGPSPRVNEPLHQGRVVQLESGLARLIHASGAEVLLMGPTRYRMLGKNAGELQSGRLTAQVSPPAHGFVVETPRLRVIDRGTDFGVASQQDHTSVHVFQGQVEVASRSRTGDPAPLLLATGQSAQVRKGAGQHLVRTAQSPAELQRFVRAMPIPEPPLLRVDFGLNGHRAEAGWVAAEGDRSVTATEGHVTEAPGGMQVVLEAPDAPPRPALAFRGVDPSAQRGSLAGHSRGAMLEDFVFSYAGDLTVRIQGLPAGDYLYTSWHNESSTEAKYQSLPRKRQFTVSVHGAPRARASVGILPLGQTPAERCTAVSFPVAVAAGEDLVIRYQILDDPREPHLYLNGLQLRRLPPPQSEP